MVRSDLAAAGVMFTIDTESGFPNAILINSIYGLGENIVQGKVNPDEFYVFKPTKAIISRSIGKKRLKMILIFLIPLCIAATLFGLYILCFYLLLQILVISPIYCT